MTPLERAARAVAKENCDTDRNWQLWLDDARAVLLAIRDPSEGMVDAGAPIIANVACLGDADGPAPDSEFTGYAEAVWQAMLDVAIGDME